MTGITRRQAGGGVAALGLATLARRAAAQGGTVKIGSLHPLTGPLALDGKQMDDAIKLAAEAINAAGGIKALGGAKLEILSADTQGRPDVGQTEAQRQIDSGAVALIGCYQSAVSQNVATVATRARVPLVLDITAADSVLQQGSRFVFRIQPNASTIGLRSAEFLKYVSDANGGGVKRIAYLRDESEFGRSIFAAFKRRAEELGMEVPLDIAFDPFRTTDLTTEMTRVRAGNVDVLAVTGYFNDGVLVARTANAVKPQLKALWGVASAAFEQQDFVNAVGAPAAEGVLCATIRYNGKSPRIQELQALYRERFGQEMRLSAPFGYQALQVVAAGLEKVSQPRGQALRDAIAGLELNSPLLAYPGPIKFDDKGENINAAPQLVQTQGGRITQVWPQSFAEAAPKFPSVPWSA